MTKRIYISGSPVRERERLCTAKEGQRVQWCRAETIDYTLLLCFFSIRLDMLVTILQSVLAALA